MAIYSLKKSYQLKDLHEVDFKDLWGDHGIFTTMWIFGKPAKILFFDNHIKNLIKSLQIYGIKKRSLQKDLFKIIKINLNKKRNYNHLLRLALNKKIISISLRKRITPKLDFNLKIVNFKRDKSKYKNLKYKKILSYLYKKKFLETGTSNLFFIKDNKIFTPKKDYYEGNTFKFFKSRIKKVTKKDILINELKKYDEIILVGSGKGVTSVKTIKQMGWKRKNLNQFKIFLKHYRSAIKNCKQYKF